MKANKFFKTKLILIVGVFLLGFFTGTVGFAFVFSKKEAPPPQFFQEDPNIHISNGSKGEDPAVSFLRNISSLDTLDAIEADLKSFTADMFNADWNLFKDSLGL